LVEVEAPTGIDTGLPSTELVPTPAVMVTEIAAALALLTILPPASTRLMNAVIFRLLPEVAAWALQVQVDPLPLHAGVIVPEVLFVL
jgi:hypothetical protein